MKKTIISCVLFLTAVTAFSQTPMKTAAEAKLSASDLAVKIADRILATTTYEFKNTKTGKTYKSVKNLRPVMEMGTHCCAFATLQAPSFASSHWVRSR